MQIEQKGDRLMLSTGEGRPWASSLFIALFVGGIATAILVGLVRDWARDGFSLVHLGGVLIPIVVTAFARDLAHAHHATVEIDERFGRIAIERRFLFKTLTEKLRFEEVQGFAIHETEDDGSPRYQLKLACRDGRHLILGQRIADRAGLDNALAALAGLAKAA